MEMVNIKIVEIIEHEDGSATCELDICDEAQQLLIEKGFIAILEEIVDKSTAQDSK